MNDHIGDDAQLFALGVLDPQERAAVETHARDCAACSVELGRAEAAVAAMNDATALSYQPPDRLEERIRASAMQAATTVRRPIPLVDRVRGWYAIGALFVLGLLVVTSIVQNVRLRHGLEADDLAFGTIARSHFLHVSFTGNVPAKVLYARDGSWAYVIVATPDCRCRIVAPDGATARDLGKPQRRGRTETLLIRDLRRPQGLALLDERNSVLATAALAY